MRPENGRAGSSRQGGQAPNGLRLAAALLVATSALNGCATGDPITTGTTSGGGSTGDGGRSGDGGSNGAGASGQGNGGAGATTASNGPGVTSTTGPGGTSTNTSSPASSSSTGTPCDEDPCKLVAPQCGCGVDEMCTLAGGGSRICTDEGARSPGQQCGGALGSCSAGALCVYVFETDNAISSCSRFCNADDQCDGQGSVCALGLNGVDDVKLCSEACDLVSSTGCAIAGTKCGFGYDEDGARYLNVCVGSGAGVAQDLCGTGETNLCAPGFDCFRTGEAGEVYRCFEWCSTAAPGCSGGLTCRTDVFDPALTIGAVTYGVCSN